jgi:hypothetical protein
LSSLLACIVLSTSLVSCSSGGTDDAYCESIEGSTDIFDVHDFNDPEAIGKSLARVEDIAAEAPDEVADDWDMLRDFLRKVRDASENDDPGAVAELDPSGLSEARSAIEKHAMDECDVELAEF